MSFFNSIVDRLNVLKQSRHFKYGLPFFTLILGGPLVIREFQQAGRYDNRRVRSLDREDKKIFDQEFKSSEEIYEEYVKSGVKKDYQMIRGPRPWEPDTIKENLERRKRAAEAPGVQIG